MKTLKRVGLVLLSIALVGSVAAGLSAWHAGYRLYAVRTGSMAPAYPTGDLIVTEPPSGSYAVGDVVTFRSAGGSAAVTTHRVSGVDGAELETKGDANRTPDAVPVGADDVVGRVIGAVPRGGFALVFLQQPTGGLAFVVTLGALVLLWGVFFPAADAVRSGPAGTTADPERPRDQR